jgi:hypothetical protein
MPPNSIIPFHTACECTIAPFAILSSALKSGPVPVFCHIGGGPEPDRSNIKGNSQKTGPRLKKTTKNQSKPVQTSLCKDCGPDWSKPVMTFFFQHPLTYCRQNTQKNSQIGPELSDISSKPSLNAKFVHVSLAPQLPHLRHTHITGDTHHQRHTHCR